MNTPLLQRRYGGTTGHDWREDVAVAMSVRLSSHSGSKHSPFHGDTERQGNDIEKEKVGSVGGSGLAGEDTGLNGCAISDGLVRVDALLELLAVEEVTQKLLYPGNAGGATNKYDLVDLALLETSVLEDLFYGLEGPGEGLAVDVLETCAGDVGIEVLAVEE